MFLQKLIKHLLKGLLLFSFRSELFGVIIFDKDSFKPVFIQIIFVPFIFPLDKAFEFPEFFIGLCTKLWVTNSLRLDTLILLVPKIRIDGEFCLGNWIQSPAIPQTQIYGGRRFRIIPFCRFFDDKCNFHVFFMVDRIVCKLLYTKVILILWMTKIFSPHFPHIC